MEETRSEVRKGIVKWFDIKKGYGFITDSETGEDYFAHFSGITKGRSYTSLEGEDEVSFTIGKGKHGDEAKGIVITKLATTEGRAAKAAKEQE